MNQFRTLNIFSAFFFESFMHGMRRTIKSESVLLPQILRWRKEKVFVPELFRRKLFWITKLDRMEQVNPVFSRYMHHVTAYTNQWTNNAVLTRILTTGFCDVRSKTLFTRSFKIVPSLCESLPPAIHHRHYWLRWFGTDYDDSIKNRKHF